MDQEKAAKWKDGGGPNGKSKNMLGYAEYEKIACHRERSRLQVVSVIKFI